MTDRSSDVSQGKAALYAAVSSILMAILAPIANFSILNGLVAPEDAATTFNNIAASQSSFRMAIFFFFIVVVLDIIIAWALYIFLIPVNKGLSLLTAWFRVVYATILAAALFYLVNVFQFLNGADYLTSFEMNHIHDHVLLSVKSFFVAWEFGLIIFALHLMLLGYLMFKAGYMKKILGILLIIASAGYLIDGVGKMLFSNYDVNIAAFTFWGEIVLIFWLLISGRKVDGLRSDA